MYSVVLMAALSTSGPDAVSFGHRRGGCYGGSCWGCSGCVGCSGCWGGCSGCWGGCSGCWGGHYGGQCIGGGGWPAYGGCYGWYTGGWHCYGGTACYGGCYGSCIGHAHYAGCYGGCYGSPQPIWYHGYAMPYHDSGNPMTAPKAEPIKEPKGSDAKPMGGAAKLILDVPANSQLFVDDLPMKGTDTTRHFATPALEPGQTYYYTVRVESNRDGKPVSETRRVLVRANQEFRESFVEDKAAVARGH